MNFIYALFEICSLYMADSMVFVSKHGIFKPYEYLKENMK